MRFLEVISGWINRHFSNEEAIYLVMLIVVCFLVLFFLGGYLAPVLTGLVVAFLLQGVVKKMMQFKISRGISIYLTFILFIGLLVTILLFLVPLIWRQLQALAISLPGLIGRLREATADLPESIATLITPAQVDAWLQAGAGELGNLSATLLEAVVTQVPSLVGVLLYVVLVPVSVFFFLKDGPVLMAWYQSLLPKKRPLLDQVGAEMNIQIANYVRGKAIEMLIVGSVSFVGFELFGLNYSALLALLVGLSVLIPFVGAAVVTIPVAMVAFIQWGWTPDFFGLFVFYSVVQFVDGNFLVPLLFAEVVNLHPITIIVAVLVFGGLWGVWGVFFAIPLATLVKAIYTAWPRQPGEIVQPET